MSPTKNIKIMTAGDISALNTLTTACSHETEPRYFERALEEQEQGKRIVLVYEGDGGILGYVHYNRFPGYQPFSRFNIPEIQDLFVSSDARRQGIGNALVEYCEEQARVDGHQEIGIGVGIVSSFGNAQRIYVSRGYVPDGAGVVFERQAVQTGELRPLDDRLCLMLVKQLA